MRICALNQHDSWLGLNPASSENGYRLEHKTMRVQPEDAKKEHRIRVIPLNKPAWRAMTQLWQRSETIGCSQPHHYPIPFRLRKGIYDPDRPAEGWRRALARNAGRGRDSRIRLQLQAPRDHEIT